MDSSLVEHDAITTALSVPGLCCEDELRFLYRLGLKAPTGFPFVELGTYQGRTATILAMTGHQVITIENYIHDRLFRKPPVAWVPERAQRVADRLAAFKLNIQVVLGDSAVIPFDDLAEIALLFIDSEHTEERLCCELDTWLPLLVEDGILALHDYYKPDLRLVIDQRIKDKTDEWEYLGLAVWLVGFKRLK